MQLLLQALVRPTEVAFCTAWQPVASCSAVRVWRESYPTCALSGRCCVCWGVRVMGRFVRDRLPNAVSFFEGEGLTLVGRGAWRTTGCQFHGGSDSMRVNVQSAAWVCMNCGARGGDAISFVMGLHGLDFADACKRLGCWDEGAKGDTRPPRPRLLSAREALSVISVEILVLVVVLADARRGVLPSARDWHRFLEGVGRIERLATEYAS